MGIKDLLRFMKPYIEPINIKKYAGQRVGIDAYSWLHKGAYSCSMELCLNTDGDKKLQYLKYFMHRINLLRHYKITPVVVLDGGDLPCKSLTKDERERKRRANCDLAMEKLKEGDTAAASELFQRGVSITPLMAHQLIQILREEDIEYVVAPYEADAQLAYMCTIEAEKGGIVAVISEDSDLLAYGCPSVIFKMDKFGNGEEIILDRVFDSADCIPNFRNLDKQLFTGMCVLAGCDFLPSIPGIGISKAHGLVSKYRNLDRVVSVLKFDKGSQVPENYARAFKEAVAVFHHARVYDAALNQLKHIKPIPETLLQSLDENFDFLGPEVAPAFAIGIARGDINPCTMEAFDQNPSHGSLIKTNKIFNITRLQTKEPPSLPSKDGCFSVVPSICSRQGASVTEQKRVVFSAKTKCLNKETEVEKLILNMKDDTDNSNTQAAERRTNATNETSRFPDNNPFKRAKQVHFTEITEKVENEDVSKVIEAAVESPEIVSMAVVSESQQTMESKPEIIHCEKKSEIGNVRKGKRSKCESLKSDKTSTTILSFFSRA